MPYIIAGIGAILLYMLWPRAAAATPTGDITVGDEGTSAKHGTIDGQTRGERNNNPGNIAKGASHWLGQTGDDGVYCTFDTAIHGIRAIAHVLLSYQNKDNVRTIDAMIRRYSASDQAAYVKNVSDFLGLTPTDKPDLTDHDTLTMMVTAIIFQENGRVSYEDAVIAGAVLL